MKLLQCFGRSVFSSTIVMAALSAAGCAHREDGSPPKAPRHILFITVDTLRADHMSLYGYLRRTSPALDELARRGVVFDRAIAQWPKTGTSFASIFTGQYPQSTGLTHRAALRIPDAYLTLPELLSQSGFTSLAVVSNGCLTKELGWDQGFKEFHETQDLEPSLKNHKKDGRRYREWSHARQVNKLALPLLEKYRDAERLFVWVHYIDPHIPYELPADVVNPFLDDPYYTGDEEAKIRRTSALGDRRDLKYYLAQYDANILFADQHIGELLDHARELGILDRALVIFSSDHGESLGEHDYYFGHGALPYNASAHVPLVISYPPVTENQRRIDVPVELVDLYPTLQEWFLPDKPVSGLEGNSLLPFLHPAFADGKPGSAGESNLAFSEAGHKNFHYRSVQDARWKLVYHPPRRDREKPRWEFYRLDEDPMETRNLARGEPSADFRRLHRELTGWMKGNDWIRRSIPEMEEQSQKISRALRALGYVE